MVSTTQDIRIRISKEQKIQLCNLAEANGHRTLSSYVRSQVFTDLSTQTKLNNILNLLKQKNNGDDKNEQRT